MWRDSACRYSAMFRDSKATTSVHWRHVAPNALVYHRGFDGDHSDDSARSVAAAGRPRTQDAALLVADCRVRGGGRRALARVRGAQDQELSVVGDAVLLRAHPVEPLVAEPRGGGAA